MDRFVISVNDWKPLTIITKPSLLDVAAVLDPPRLCSFSSMKSYFSETIDVNREVICIYLIVIYVTNLAILLTYSTEIEFIWSAMKLKCDH